MVHPIDTSLQREVASERKCHYGQREADIHASPTERAKVGHHCSVNTHEVADRDHSSSQETKLAHEILIRRLLQRNPLLRVSQLMIQLVSEILECVF